MNDATPDPTRGSTGDPTGSGSSSSTDPIGYAEALAELESILRELEGADVDVDRLADRVARAAELVRTCRERIVNARLRIDEVVADLDDDLVDDLPDGAGDRDPT